MTLTTIISVLLADSKNAAGTQTLEGLATRSGVVASALIKLVSEDRAGNWPPRVAHYALPACFQPYQDIYLKAISGISTTTPMLYDAINKKRMAEFRGTIAKLLAERVNLLDVKAALKRLESGRFRSVHKIRARPYLEQPAPERLIVTAGTSVIETSQTKCFDDAYEPLDDTLATQTQLAV
ncbi:hypothetical protein EKO27_g11558 [Xylaria grammica]|uniref:Uncharacterized protein n=1 Tax=Xylaria grammica TaxID=363999 RepID=A0A439CN37_9PEZI|nr:hypothetical protein EKO27_g11558 [Xylaria grammica]